MKAIFVILSTVLSLTTIFAQQNKDVITGTDKAVLALNNLTDYKTVKLENTDFLDSAFINQGSEGYGILLGYFINDKLFKIREVLGFKKTGDIAVTEYYFDDSELFFVYESEKAGKDIFVSPDGTLDYRIDQPDFSVKYYFNNSKLITRTEEGVRETMLLPNEMFFDSQSKEGQLLDSSGEFSELLKLMYVKE